MVTYAKLCQQMRHPGKLAGAGYMLSAATSVMFTKCKWITLLHAVPTLLLQAWHQNRPQWSRPAQVCWSACMQVHQAANSFAQHLGKSVCNSQDRPGFIVNRVLMPMINEAFYALMEVGAQYLYRRCPVVCCE